MCLNLPGKRIYRCETNIHHDLSGQNLQPEIQNICPQKSHSNYFWKTYGKTYQAIHFSWRVGITSSYTTVCPEKSVTLTISENIPKPRNKLWILCSDAWENLHKTHMCLGQGLAVSVQLKKFHNLFRGFGIFSEIVRGDTFLGHTVMWL